MELAAEQYSYGYEARINHHHLKTKIDQTTLIFTTNNGTNRLLHQIHKASTVDSSNSIFSSRFGQTGTGSTGMTPTLEEQQEGLPEEIKSKTYPSSDLITAEDELVNDLEKYFLLDSDTMIVVNDEGKAVWEMPTVFHQDALQKLLKIVNKSSEEEDFLLAQAGIPLLMNKEKAKYRHPESPSGAQVAWKQRARMEISIDDTFRLMDFPGIIR
ncbi:expressed unknown protein [Seminavis robusta]|uniref:Uncharacterized protein n=1 Tax=Seminavis robusta TaxID=568900 RepID=A0A9N8HD52_9STRA|nr:expressed unknown protein [Seminavis robusta]|eukprot:Sro443_g144120.1 n/a (213) ;mRNA; f:43315-43953